MNIKQSRGISFFLSGWLFLVGVACQQTSPPTSTPSTQTIVSLNEPLTEAMAIAQAVVLKDEGILSEVEENRAELFGIYDVEDGHFSEGSEACRQSPCQRVEIYDFDQNRTIMALVNLQTEAIVETNIQEGVQPVLNNRLYQLALDLVKNDERVNEILADRPKDFSMAGVPSALDGSSCEGAHHLCVAPTLQLDNRIMWVIVDLTIEEVVSIEWTGKWAADSSPDNLITPMPPADCFNEIHLKRDGWEMNHIISASDGLRLSDVTFQGSDVLRSVKLTDWHVNYTEAGFGYNDAIGCINKDEADIIYPMAPTSIEDIIEHGEIVGFAVVQQFGDPNWGDFCSYRYEQRYQFYQDGSFRLASGAYGKGCGPDGWYRPVERIDVAVGGDDGDSFAEWDGDQWITWRKERWRLQFANTPYTPEGYQYRVMDLSGMGYYIEPGQGQFEDAGIGDNAYLYVTKHHPNEGDTDLGSFGSCCNDDHEQGPHLLMQPPEPLTPEDNIVIWYVAQHKNSATPGSEYCWTELPNTWPCFGGAKFVPVK